MKKLNCKFLKIMCVCLLVVIANSEAGAILAEDKANKGEVYEVIIPENEVRENYSAYGFESEEDYLENLELYNSGKTRAITIAGTISVVTGSCYVIQAISGFDPCAWAIRNIWDGMKTGLPKGKYRVTRTFIKGRVPGCEPMHSYQCNAGYWKYYFSKI